jgi:adenine/guanine/hypoxanthine permease
VALAYLMMAGGFYALGRTNVSVPYTVHMDMPHGVPAE